MSDYQKEEYCLNRVKNFCCNNDSKLSYSKISKISYGLTSYDINEILVVLLNAIPNEEKNKFPDFVFSNGFIEHFSITSSMENENGSQQAKTVNEIIKNNIKEIKKNEKDAELSHSEPSGIKTVKVNIQHNYNNFISSFSKNWNSHINSLKKYSGNKDIGIFIIDYEEPQLSMEEVISLREDITLGSLSDKTENLKTIYLSRCKELLNYIFCYKNIIKYVIYVTTDEIEIIKTSEAAYIASLLKNKYIYQ